MLRALAHTEDNQTYIIDSSVPTAFTGGLIKPSCFISTELFKQLNEDEIAIIVQHEKAHIHYADPLKKWLFSFFAAYFVTQIKHRLIAMMSLAMEQDADTFFVKNKSH